MIMKIATTKYPVNDLIKKRWSPRAFSEAHIENDTIMSLFEAASWAPSSRNEQPWRFIYGTKDNELNYNKIYNCLDHWNKQWANNAPLLVLSIGKLNFDYHNRQNNHALYDLGQSVTNFILQATSLNLYCHQMGGFDDEKAIEVFKLPSNYKPVSVIAVGNIGNPDILPEDMKELELKERTRLDLDKIIFNNNFHP